MPTADTKVKFSNDSGIIGVGVGGNSNSNKYDWTTYDDAELAELNFVEIDGEPVQLRKKSPIHPQKTQVIMLLYI